MKSINRKLSLKWIKNHVSQDLREESSNDLLRAIESIMYQYHVNIMRKDPKTMRVKRSAVKFLKT